VKRTVNQSVVALVVAVLIEVLNLNHFAATLRARDFTPHALSLMLDKSAKLGHLMTVVTSFQAMWAMFNCMFNEILIQTLNFTTIVCAWDLTKFAFN
jgi:hypothetical protein